MPALSKSCHWPGGTRASQFGHLRKSSPRSIGVLDWQCVPARHPESSPAAPAVSETKVRVQKLDQIECDIGLLGQVGPSGSASLDAGLAHFLDQALRVAFSKCLADVCESTVRFDEHGAVHKRLDRRVVVKLYD